MSEPDSVMMPLTSSEIEHLASEAAKKAVRELLIQMGVNANDPDALIEMQKDFAHIRDWRQATTAIKTKGLMVAISIFVTGMCGAVWMAMRGGH